MPFAASIVACAAAEAFWGDKEPMFQTLLGFVFGVSGAVLVFALATGSARVGSPRIAKAVIVFAATFGVMAIPLARLMIRIAYSYPGHRIPW